MSRPCRSHADRFGAALARLATAALALSVGGGCYDYTLSDGERRSEPRGDAGDAAAPAAEEAGPSPSRCLAGGYYCGGGKVEGRTDSVYRCTAEGAGALVERCANGCLVSPAAEDDRCSPPTPCTIGGAYCGGDKVNGDPDVLYRCLANDALEVIARCPSACQWNDNADDTCR